MAGVTGLGHMLISKVVAEVGKPGRLVVAGLIRNSMPARLGCESGFLNGSCLPLDIFLAAVYNGIP